MPINPHDFWNVFYKNNFRSISLSSSVHPPSREIVRTSLNTSNWCQDGEGSSRKIRTLQSWNCYRRIAYCFILFKHFFCEFTAEIRNFHLFPSISTVFENWNIFFYRLVFFCELLGYTFSEYLKSDSY